ncbi:MAG TPA: DUF4382 domain-containing protein [Chitinophagaceae bacterium]|nr:DUF4382 domain-containing protein [Chitinophagaceae bacterium]
MKKPFLLLLSSFLTAAIILMACQKDNNDAGSTTLKVRMTDAPINADFVNVDIREVKVNFRDDSSGWVSLNTVAGIYDLLGLQNGVDTLLAVGVIPGNSVKEIRFVLGPNNSIVVNGVNYPLTIPSGSESGLKLKINKQLSGPVDSLLIDFDAALSIHQTGNGEYKLKPVLKIK